MRILEEQQHGQGPVGPVPLPSRPEEGTRGRDEPAAYPSPDDGNPKAGSTSPMETRPQEAQSNLEERPPRQKGQGQAHPAELMKSCWAPDNLKTSRSESPNSSSESSSTTGSTDSPTTTKKNTNSASPSKKAPPTFCRHWCQHGWCRFGARCRNLRKFYSPIRFVLAQLTTLIPR